MKPSQFTEEQIIGILRKQDAGAKTAEVCLKPRHQQRDLLQARRLKTLEDENTKPKKLLGEAMLDSAMLKEIASKNVWHARSENGFYEVTLSSLRQRIRPIGIAAAKMEIHASRSS